jgi:hypothetical protein
MKRILLILALAVSAIATFAQDPVKVTTSDGKVISGYFVIGTDTTYTIKCTDHYITNKYGTDTITFRMADIREVYMYNKTFVPYEGKLVAKKSVTSKLGTEVAIVSNGNQSSIYTSKPGDPNYMIGKALKSTGGVAIGIGVPCTVAGTILLAVGKSMQKSIDYTKLEDVKRSIKGSDLQLAGCILLPLGASLTIVGIPLYAHGKKIMTMNFNYTGNGVGVAMQF